MKKLSKITEGILGDIAKRDLSGGTKKEDDIDNMSFTDFYYYVLDHYEVKNNQFEITLSKRYTDDVLIITFPVIKFKLKTMTGITDKESYIEMVFTDDEKYFSNISNNVLSYCPDFEAGIGNDYECDKGTIMIRIHPKNNKLDNGARLELIDKVIEVLGDDCILKKK